MDEEWELHKILGKRIGLEMSPGKAYIHPRYANVNSTSVDMDLRLENSTPWEIKFLNVGLLNGQHKVLGKVGSEEEQKEHPLSAVIDEVVKGALPGKQADVFKIYCSMHKSELSVETRGRNLFIPKVLGGMGVTPISGIETHITTQQGLVAESEILRSHVQPLERPLPMGYLVRDKATLQVDPLRVAPQPGDKVKFSNAKLPLNRFILYPWWGDFEEIRAGNGTKDGDKIPWGDLRGRW